MRLTNRIYCTGPLENYLLVEEKMSLTKVTFSHTRMKMTVQQPPL